MNNKPANVKFCDMLMLQHTTNCKNDSLHPLCTRFNYSNVCMITRTIIDMRNDEKVVYCKIYSNRLISKICNLLVASALQKIYRGIFDHVEITQIRKCVLEIIKYNLLKTARPKFSLCAKVGIRSSRRRTRADFIELSAE